jgi:hypothetical protein
MTRGAIRSRAQRGGRPQKYADRDPVVRQREASRAYRARQRAKGTSGEASPATPAPVTIERLEI